jgi:hypothetical protein
MTEVRDQLADLASSAGKEIARLARVDAIDARNELQFRVWPFLAEMVDIIEDSLEADSDPAMTIPVETVARAVALLLVMANRLGEVLPKSDMDALALRAAEVTEELMSLCDPDELALYVQREGAPAPYAEESSSARTMIDATLVEHDRAQPDAAAVDEDRADS